MPGPKLARRYVAQPGMARVLKTMAIGGLLGNLLSSWFSRTERNNL